MSLFALLLAAAPAEAPPPLACSLVTPRGDLVAFTARPSGTGVGAVSLTPEAGSVWPASRLAGGGGIRARKDGFEGAFHFGGRPGGMSLEIDGELATLHATRGTRNELPRAYGFCIAATAQDTGGPVGTDAKADIEAFDPAAWPEACALLTRGGRRARVDYSVLDMGGRSELRSGNEGLFPSGRVVASRRQGSRGRSTFSGGGMAGAERLLTTGTAAVQLIEFTKRGETTEPAVAICGHSMIERRPSPQ